LVTRTLYSCTEPGMLFGFVVPLMGSDVGDTVFARAAPAHR
jgi:hypothetical protein